MRLLQLQACLLLLVLGEPCRGPAVDAPAEGAGDACATNAWPAGGVCLKTHGRWQRASVQEDQVMDEALEGFQMDG